MVDQYMEKRPLEWRGNPRAPSLPIRTGGDGSVAEGAQGAQDGEGKLTKNQLKKLEKLKRTAEKKEGKMQAKASGEPAAPPAA